MTDDDSPASTPPGPHRPVLRLIATNDSPAFSEAGTMGCTTSPGQRCLSVTRGGIAQCRHMSVDIDDAARVIHCGDCDAELDVWWFVGQLADQEAEFKAVASAQHREYEAWLGRANAMIRALTEDINALGERRATVTAEVVALEARLGSMRMVSTSRPRRRR